MAQVQTEAYRYLYHCKLKHPLTFCHASYPFTFVKNHLLGLHHINQNTSDPNIKSDATPFIISLFLPPHTQAMLTMPSSRRRMQSKNRAKQSIRDDRSDGSDEKKKSRAKQSIRDDRSDGSDENDRSDGIDTDEAERSFNRCTNFNCRRSACDINQVYLSDTNCADDLGGGSYAVGSLDFSQVMLHAMSLL